MLCVIPRKTYRRDTYFSSSHFKHYRAKKVSLAHSLCSTLTHYLTVDFSGNAILTARRVKKGTLWKGLTDFVWCSIGEPLAAFELVAVAVAAFFIGGHQTSKIISLLAFSFYKTLQFSCLSKQQQYSFNVLYIKIGWVPTHFYSKTWPVACIINTFTDICLWSQTNVPNFSCWFFLPWKMSVIHGKNKVYCIVSRQIVCN
jgi:hypothetical protein